MDPKNMPTLDPKLKEAYERVMSTSLPTPPAATPPTPAAPTTLPVTAKEEAAPAPVAIHAPTTEGPKPISSTTSSTTFVAGSNGGHSGSKISPILLVIAGIIFFAVYTLFWLRFFNISLPFLP